MPTFLSLFAGVGGFDLGLERAGFRCVGQVEIDPFARRVLERRWPHVARWADVREWQGDGHEHVDLLVGGFPCQDLSIAGKRAGLGGERSGLFWEIVRIAKEIRPAWGFFENVPGLLSSHRGRDMALVIAGLRECWPVVGWRIVDSRYFGVAQRRRRVFFVCGPDEARVAAVLFEPEGGGGNSAAGGEAGAGVAASLTSGSHGAGVNPPGRRNEDDVIVRQAISKRQDGSRSDKLPIVVTHALTHEGHDASEDGTGRGTPIIAIQDARAMDKAQNGLGVSQEGVAYTVDSQATQAIAFQCHGSNVGPMGTLRQGNGNVTGGVPAVAFDTTQITSDKNYSNPKPGDPCHPLAAGAHPPAVASAMAVRRLTPVECEKLQSFPPGWTCLCLPLEDYAHDPEAAAERCTCPDSPRYKAMGNAVTVNVIEHFGRRLMAAL